MIAVDTNILIRFFVVDDEKQYEQVLSLLEHNEVFISKTVILETEWVLHRLYKRSSTNIITGFEQLLKLSNVIIENELEIQRALGYYKKGFDFADSLHLVSSKGCKKFYTFDKKFKNKSIAANTSPKVLSPS